MFISSLLCVDSLCTCEVMFVVYSNVVISIKIGCVFCFGLDVSSALREVVFLVFPKILNFSGR